MTKMFHKIPQTIELIQWFWILVIGLFTSIVPQYQEGLFRVLWTVLSMAIGTIVSFYIKRWLNKRKERKNN